MAARVYRWPAWRAASVRCAALPSRDGADRCPDQPREPQARTRRGRPVRRAGRDRAGSTSRRRRSSASPPTSDVTPTSGPRSSPSSACDVPPAGPPRARVRFIVLVARLLGTNAVTDLVKALEGDEEEAYDAQGTSPEVAAIAADEREHARIWDQLRDGGESAATVAAAGGGQRDGVDFARRARTPAEIGAVESWHRAGGRSGTLRAVIFGVSDGLVSNLSLVMGVAGAATEDPSFILLAGIAGLLAGSFSMAAGRVHLDAEPAGAVRAPDRAGAGRDGGHARGRGGRAGRRVPRQGLHPGGGHPDRPSDLRGPGRGAGHAGPRGARAWTPTSSVPRCGPPSGRSWPSRSGRPCRSSRTSSVAVPPCCS